VYVCDFQDPHVQFFCQLQIHGPLRCIQIGVDLDQQRIVSDFLESNPVMVLQNLPVSAQQRPNAVQNGLQLRCCRVVSQPQDRPVQNLAPRGNIVDRLVCEPGVGDRDKRISQRTEARRPQANFLDSPHFGTDTTTAQLQDILDGIRALLSAHGQILQDDHRVRFREIADDALLVEVYAYLDTTEWSVYLELGEELNMRILEIVAQAGTSLSLPARTLHIEQSDGNKAAIA